MTSILKSSWQEGRKELSKIYGHLDDIVGREVVGWAWFLDDKSKTVLVDILVNGQVVETDLPCSLERSDLRVSGYNSTRHGFRFILDPKHLLEGENVVVVRESSSNKPLIGSPKTFIFIPNLKAKGALDKPRHGSIIIGWAAYEGKSRRVKVSIHADGDYIGQVLATSYRKDLSDKGIGVDGFSGFEMIAPARLFDGTQHRIEIFDDLSGERIAGRSEVIFKQQKEYNDFESFLDWAFFFREIHAPFTEIDKRVLSYCEWISKHTNVYQSVSQEVLISVIMPTFNRASFIRVAIDSVLSQTYQNYELIIVDDGSSDETGYIIQTYSDIRIKYIKFQNNMGVSAARNAALEIARGELISYLDSDNWWDKNYLYVMAYMFSIYPKFQSAYCGQYLYMPGDQNPFSVRLGPFNYTLIRNRNYIDLNCFAHTSDAYKKYGGFDTTLRRLVDWDLILRYTRDNKPLFVPCNLSHYVVNNTSPSISNTESLDEAFSILASKGNITTSLVGTVPEVTLTFPKIIMYAPFDENHQESAGQDRERPCVSVLIPSFNIPEILELCIQHLLPTLSDKDEVIIVDNNSQPVTCRKILEMAERDSRVRHLFNRQNFGFSKAINQAANIACQENDVVIFNNDTIVTPGWLEHCYDALRSDNKIGAVAPQQVLPANTHTMLDHAPYCNTCNEVDVNVSWHHRNLLSYFGQDNENYFIEVNFVPFFCILIRRSLFENLGGLDEELGRHYRSDRIFCNALRHMYGFRIIQNPRAKVYHLLQQSTKRLKEISAHEYRITVVENSWNQDLTKNLPFWL